MVARWLLDFISHFILLHNEFLGYEYGDTAIFGSQNMSFGVRGALFCCFRFCCFLDLFDGFWMLVFMSLFLRIIVILERDTVIFSSQNLLFGRPGFPLLHPGALGDHGDDPGDPWEHKEGGLEVQTRIFIDSGWF